MSALFNGLQEFLGTSLAFFYDLIPSFGLAIIMLTLAINLVLFPLTLKQTRSTRAFQTIQPEIKRIQKEFKEEPETMQRELMRVQREAGATPGGCLLPLIVQMPIWFALFRLLQNVADIANGVEGVVPKIPAESALLATIEAGNTHFLGLALGNTMSQGVLSGFVSSLPYVFMMVLMVASQYFQQWHAQRGQGGKAGLTQQQQKQQQTQQAITRIMPLFIGFISWNFPAGLVLYWSTSNLFRLGQQFVIFAIDGRPQAPASEEPPPPSDNGQPKKPHPVSEKKRRRRRK